MGRQSGSAEPAEVLAQDSHGRSQLCPLPGHWLNLPQLHSIVPPSPLSSPQIPTFPELFPPSAPGLRLAFLLSSGIFFPCCFTLYLIIVPHFLPYLKSRLMPVSCVHFGNKIYGNACHWFNCFPLASNFLMITNCLPVQETVPSWSSNLLAFNCNQKLEVWDCILHQALAILGVREKVGNPRSLYFKAQMMVHRPNKK